MNCKVETDKDKYELGEKITINYSNAPRGSLLNITNRARWFKIGARWSVSNDGTKEHVSKKADLAGTWSVTLWHRSRGCLSRKYFQVVACKNGHEVLERCCADNSEKSWRNCINGTWEYGKRKCPIPEEAQLCLTKAELNKNTVDSWEEVFRLAITVKNIGKKYTRYGVGVLFDEKCSDYYIRADRANGLPWGAEKEWTINFNYPHMIGLKQGKHELKVIVGLLGDSGNCMVSKIHDSKIISFDVIHSHPEKWREY